MKHILISLPIAALIALGGCSEPAGETDTPRVEATPEPTPSSPAQSQEIAETPSATTGGDGSEITLAELQYADAEGLGGELGCSFSPQDMEGNVLIAKGVVQSEDVNFGRVRIGDYVEPVASNAPGYDSMVEGGKFSSRGLTLTVSTMGEIETGNESSASEAELLVQRMDGAERTYTGIWTCGP